MSNYALERRRQMAVAHAAQYQQLVDVARLEPEQMDSPDLPAALLDQFHRDLHRLHGLRVGMPERNDQDHYQAGTAAGWEKEESDRYVCVPPGTLHHV